jgi:hypothetical protein
VYRSENNSLSLRQRNLKSKLQKLLKRIQHKVANGSFHLLSRRRQQQLLSTLRRYAGHLGRVGIVVRGVTAVLALSLAMTNVAQAQIFTIQTGVDNPFDGVNVGYFSAPTLVDVDNDGDFDAFIGEYSGSIKYYENTGNNGSPTFTEQTGVDNPFDGVVVGPVPKPAFVDIDNDGDFDAFIGEGGWNN